MQSGKIVSMDPAAGRGSIQPDDGTETLSFLHSDLIDAAEHNSPVTFDTGKSIQGGIQATNIRVVKATE